MIHAIFTLSIRRLLLTVLLSTALRACATSPLGRSQIKLYSGQDMAQMGALAFKQTTAKTPVTQNTRLTGFVNCVAGAITRHANYQAN